MAKFKQVFELINTETKFSRLTQLSNTRWLSRFQAIDKILTQYVELIKTFFQRQAQTERIPLFYYQKLIKILKMLLF